MGVDEPNDLLDHKMGNARDVGGYFVYRALRRFRNVGDWREGGVGHDRRCSLSLSTSRASWDVVQSSRVAGPMWLARLQP